ncbi:MAG TPA: dihydroorotase, partial [Alphaproteobacteria bacterium]|nr:dihydroorotase [Alphaproteobacteria bacterium]
MAQKQLILRRPDDWHVHLRDGAMLQAVLPFTARTFARAIVMPNLQPPITSRAMAGDYRKRILAALPAGMKFTPLMTLYLTDGVDAGDVAAGFKEGIYTAAKLYPAHATTNSAQGVTAIRNIYPALKVMQEIGMPLLVHGEAVDPEIDIFDREKVFLEKTLKPLLREFPKLKVVLEHITTNDAAQFVRKYSKKYKLGATITPHHLHINRNAIFKGGIRPHFYCLPVAKREMHRQALVKAATSGE